MTRLAPCVLLATTTACGAAVVHSTPTGALEGAEDRIRVVDLPQAPPGLPPVTRHLTESAGEDLVRANLLGGSQVEFRWKPRLAARVAGTVTFVEVPDRWWAALAKWRTGGLVVGHTELCWLGGWLDEHRALRGGLCFAGGAWRAADGDVFSQGGGAGSYTCTQLADAPEHALFVCTAPPPISPDPCSGQPRPRSGPRYELVRGLR